MQLANMDNTNSKHDVVELDSIGSDDVDGHNHLVISDQGSVHWFERSDTCKSLLENVSTESPDHFN